jgi:hypothetical protein
LHSPSFNSFVVFHLKLGKSGVWTCAKIEMVGLNLLQKCQKLLILPSNTQRQNWHYSSTNYLPTCSQRPRRDTNPRASLPVSVAMTTVQRWPSLRSTFILTI